MNELFTALGTALASICGGDFEEATVKADLFDSHASIEYSCKRGGVWIESIESGAEDNFAVYNALTEIKKSMGDSWTRCVFMLRAKGDFSFDSELIESPLDRDDLESAFGWKD
jgi:hypothetical protein